MADDEQMDVGVVVEGLNRALELQQRSVLQFLLASGGGFGFAAQALTERLWAFAQAELHDTRLLTEKICALGGEPSTRTAPVGWDADTAAAANALIVSEDEAIAALHAVIADTGQEPRSEALEHLLEHLIMRKQHQVDWLRRAAGAVG
jgi:bacterioferritin (cytochrome b1)